MRQYALFMENIFCRKFFVFIGFIFLLSATITGCSNHFSQNPITRTGFAFDTLVTITIYDKQKENVLDHCLSLCEYYESLFSTTQEGSEVWNINHADGKTTEISYETAALIQAALYYCEQSQGVLDLTLRPVSEEWNISEQMKQAATITDYQYYIPSKQTLSELLQHVNYKNVILTDETGTKIESENLFFDMDSLDHDPENHKKYYVTLKDQQSAIDLGFIAKGYIADQLKAYLLSEGVKNGIISLGGNILLIGSKPDGSPFNVGIQKPFGAVNEVITTIQEDNTSVVSSGCYERYFTANEKDRTIYHHILDTTTGCPVQNDLLGVTIISHSSMEGDALSTYCYLLGCEEGLKYIRTLENVEALFVTNDYKIISSY